MGSTSCCNSNESLPCASSDGEQEVIVQALISPSSAEGADLSLPENTVTSLDCGLVPLQSSPDQTQPECPNSGTSKQDEVTVTEEQPSLLEGDLESGLQSQAPGSSTSSEPLSPQQQRMSPVFPSD